MDGFRIVENALPEWQLKEVRESYEASLAQVKREGTVHERVPRLLVHSPVFWRLLTNSHVLSACKNYFGAE